MLSASLYCSKITGTISSSLHLSFTLYICTTVFYKKNLTCCLRQPKCHTEQSPYLPNCHCSGNMMGHLWTILHMVYLHAEVQGNNISYCLYHSLSCFSCCSEIVEWKRLACTSTFIMAAALIFISNVSFWLVNSNTNTEMICFFTSFGSSDKWEPLNTMEK